MFPFKIKMLHSGMILSYIIYCYELVRSGTHHALFDSTNSLIRRMNMISGTMENNVEFIVNQYLPKIKYYAYKMSFNLPQELSQDDLVSAGVIGLLESMSRYDHTREASLNTFSDCRIRGAIIDEIRSMQWASRDMKKKLNAVKETYKNLEDKLSRTPLDKEVAEELGISPNKLRRVLFTANMSRLSSLQDVITGHDGETRELGDCLSAGAEADPSELFELKESREKLACAIEKLPHREKLILKLYYYEELTLKEVGAIVNLTESRTCQVLNNALQELKKQMD
ncbi:MAG: FliA/WhiG family RNA polymerase sigma factor [Nitrospirae bacterium]|nr:MAG: FliA/WhiG family RNA polymerase sigma factor [Nitrospirota bacterium]